MFKALGHLKQQSGHPNGVYQEIKKKKKCENEVEELVKTEDF